MQLKILDVSKFQPNIDYSICAHDVDGVILRCGVTYWGAQNMGKDTCFEKHYKGFKRYGAPVGAYYYSAADSVAVAEKEADYCISILKGKQFELPIYYDVENNERQGKLSRTELTNIIKAFCNKLENAGYFVGVYASTSWFTNKINFDELENRYTIWLADYRAIYNKTLSRDMHQYTSGGKVRGIDGRVDLSRCTRDFKAVIPKAGLNGYPKTATSTTVPKAETKQPEKPKFTAGQEIVISQRPLYATASAKKISSFKTGVFYIYDGVNVSGRYRITNAQNKCGKAPAALYVTGWVEL